MEPLDRLREEASHLAGLTLLVLFGSRARGQERQGSDWDLGFLAGPAFDPEELRRRAALATGGEVDVVDLARAGALVRRRAADEGRVLVEREADAFARFQIEAATFWCDAEPVLRRAYDAVLGNLP